MFQTKESTTKKTSWKKGAAVAQATTGTANTMPSNQTTKSGAISPEERNRMIAEAAYFIAEQRRFAEGSPLADWFAAEAKIDAMLSRRRA